MALVGRGNSGGINSLVEVGHFYQFVTNVRSLLHTVILGDSSGCPDEHVAHAALANVAAAMVAGETFHQHSGKIGLAIHENQFVGNEDIFKNDQRFLAAELLIAHV